MGFDNGTMEMKAPGHVHLFLNSSRGQPPETPAAPGHKSLSFAAQRMKDTTPRRLRGVQTALLKMVVEFAWIDLGEGEALGNKFDHVREKILAQAHAGYLVFPERVAASEDIEVQYEERQRIGDGHPLYGVAAKFWGLPIFTDSLFDEPTAEIPDGWIVQRFGAANIAEAA